MRRMDRYKDASVEERISRSNQNKELYENIGNNTRYTNITDVTNSNAIDLSSTKNSRTREGYHQMKEYQDVVPKPKVKKELDDFKHIYQERENRVYDINNFLEEARKNRQEKDALEEKRKLKNSSYNILASLTKEELEEYRQERLDKKRYHDNDELRELIDTITSATLAGDIKAASELLGDLMATSIIDKVEKPEIDKDVESEKEDEETDEKEEYKLSLSQEILDLEKLKKLDELAKEKDEEKEETDSKIMANADEDFYTRSMDLSDQDFELDEEFKEKKMPLIVKILIVIIILIVLSAVGLFIWRML